jgi:hypothetical protein
MKFVDQKKRELRQKILKMWGKTEINSLERTEKAKLKIERYKESKKEKYTIRAIKPSNC